MPWRSDTFRMAARCPKMCILAPVILAHAALNVPAIWRVSSELHVPRPAGALDGLGR